MQIDEYDFENNEKVIKNKQNLKEKLKKVIEKDKSSERIDDYVR